MNLSYLQYQLHHHGIERMQIRRRKNYTIASWALYSCQEEPDAGVLYVISAGELDKLGEHSVSAVFLVTDYPEGRELRDIDGIYLDKEYTFSLLINILNIVFRDYERWEFALVYSEGVTLDALLEISEPVLHMPLTVVNNEFHFMAKNRLYAELFSDDTVDKDELNSIIWTKEFQDCTHRKGVFHYYLKTEGKDLLCFNIIFSNRFYARVLGSVEDEIYGKIQEVLFGRLAACVENIFSIQKVAKRPYMRSREFCRTISGLLEGKRPVDDSILRRNGWSYADRYQVIVFRCSGYFPMEEGDKYLFRQLNNIFQEGCILEHGQDFVCVRNLSIQSAGEKDFRERLAVFLREHVAKAGLSNIFQGTADFSIYLCQAYDALRIGENKDPHFWHYNFESYAFQYLLDKCVSGYPAKEVIAPQLRQVMLADQKKGTELYHTLEMYLRNGCNASKTAEQLYIHRSSLMKRLNKIEVLTGINLEDADIRLYLELSCKLLEKQEE